MKTTRSLKTSRRVGRAGAPGIIAGLLVTALLGLAEPAESASTAIPTTASPTTTQSAIQTAAGQTRPAHGGPDSHDDHDDRDEKKDKHEKDKHEKDEHEKDKHEKDEHEKDEHEKDEHEKDEEKKEKREDGSRQDEPQQDESPEDESDPVLPTVGALQSESGVCSGTVIASGSGQLVLTAAHCVYTPEKTTPAGGVGSIVPGPGDREPGPINDEMTFVPGLSGGKEPYGWWQVEGEPFVADEWKKNGDPRFDVAILRIAKKKNGQAIQDVVGGQGTNFSIGEKSGLSVLGYPAEGEFEGKTQESCSERGDVTLFEDMYNMPCRKTLGGSSGGPWIDNLDGAGLGEIVAVIALRTIEGTPTVLGAPLGENARALIDAADEGNDESNSGNAGKDDDQNNDENNGRNNDQDREIGVEIEI